MTNNSSTDLILEGDVERDENGNAKTPGRSAAATVKHIGLMADHLRREFDVPLAQAAIAARALHNLHGMRLGTLERTRGPLTGEIIATAVENAK